MSISKKIFVYLIIVGIWPICIIGHLRWYHGFVLFFPSDNFYIGCICIGFAMAVLTTIALSPLNLTGFMSGKSTSMQIVYCIVFFSLMGTWLACGFIAGFSDFASGDDLEIPAKLIRSECRGQRYECSEQALIKTTISSRPAWICDAPRVCNLSNRDLKLRGHGAILGMHISDIQLSDAR